MSTRTWTIDNAHSGIHFSVRHLVIATVRGQFTRWDGTLTVPDDDFARASVDIRIDASSIDTGVEDRDTHLRSADFFDVGTHPEIVFTGKAVELGEDGRLELSGDLTMKGVARPVRLAGEFAGQTKDPWGGQRAAFSAKTSVDRKEFGLTWNQALETGGVMVGDEVAIEVEIQAVRQSAAEVA